MKNLLAKTSNWKFILPALLGFIYCIYLFQGYQSEMSAIAGEEVLMIDVRESYTLNEINDLFTKIKAEGREVHRYATGVTDMIFPFVYGILFILLAAFFLKKITRPDSNWMYLSLFPILLMLVDYKENFNTLNLLGKFPELTPKMVESASQITGIKSTLVSLSMGLPLILGLIYLGKYIAVRFFPAAKS
ncbi:MAG: hypothetical protein ACPG49_01270 [Chitinophagales bacterium]